MLMLLLRYFDPDIANYLDDRNITPDIFAYNWLLTLFSSRLNLRPLYKLWELMIREKDEFMIFYVSVAFLIDKK